MIRKGFTLLEALIAMTLLAAILIPVYAFLGQNIKALGTASNKIYKISATDQILNYMKTVNPMEEPRGSMNFGFFEINYESKPLLKDREIISAQSVEASEKSHTLISLSDSKRINLYETKIEVAQSGHFWFHFTLRQIGYKIPIDQAQDTSSDIPSPSPDEKSSSPPSEEKKDE